MGDTFFLVVGIILSALGILFIASAILSLVRCRESIDGTVVSLSDRTFYHRGITTHDITPTVRYRYEGNTYEKKASTSTSVQGKYRVGGNIKVIINPNNPEEFRLGTEIAPYIFGLIFLIIGAVLVVCYFL